MPNVTVYIFSIENIHHVYKYDIKHDLKLAIIQEI